MHKKSKACVPLRVTHPHFVRTFDCFAIDAELGYKDSNLEMTESESVALPFGDTPKLFTTHVIILHNHSKSKYFFWVSKIFYLGKETK